MNVYLPDRLLLFGAQDAVQSICQFMFDELDFDHFSYRRHYDSGRTVHFISNNESGHGRSFLKALYGEGVYASIDHIAQLTNAYGKIPRVFGFVTPQFSMTDVLINHQVYRKQMEFAQSFNIGNRVVFSQRFKDYYEISTFGGSSYETGVFCNFCTHNLRILQNFIKYFREQAKDLIDAAEKDPIMIAPSSTYKSIKSNPLSFIGYDFKRKEKITWRLTGQEAASLEQLASGKTFKEAARNLLISPRTVESYIHNAKTKIGCQSTHALLEIFSNLASR